MTEKCQSFFLSQKYLEIKVPEKSTATVAPSLKF